VVTRLPDTEVVSVGGEHLIPARIIRPVIVWLLAMAAACGAWLGSHIDPLRAALGIGAFVATLTIGGLIGWHGHWRALPVLGIAPPVIFLLAWIGLWLSDPVALGYFVLMSFFVTFVVATVVYPLALAILGAGALAAIAYRRLARGT
jgi:hypothetical protein